MGAVGGDDEVDKRFEALVAGADLARLRALTADWAPSFSSRAPRPDLRRPRLSEPYVYRIRVDLEGSDPLIWRTLEVTSDMTLDMLHSLLQGAFGWSDRHLYRFALGGGPFDSGSQLFLCPVDAQEGEDAGIPAELVRLDETLQEAGDVLRYVYDYGDSWELTVRVEQVREVTEEAMWAVCVAGERAAPPEDFGGIARQADLVEVFEDPSHFDLDAINRHLIDPFLLLRKSGAHPALREVLGRLWMTDIGDAVIGDALALLGPGPRFDPDDFQIALAPTEWFLNRAYPDGIELTKSGYLRPPDVEQVAALAPVSKGWRRPSNRESDTQPLLSFRVALQKVGLLRKRGGKLLLTKAGQVGRVEPDELWGHLASRLIPEKPGFEREAAVVALLYVALSPGRQLPRDRIGRVIKALGWRVEGGGEASFHDVRWGSWALDILLNVGDREPWTVSPVASALAREALFWEG